MIHIPICPESSLRSELVYVFSKINLTHSWYAFVPSYIGHYDYLDSAVRAIVNVQRDKGRDAISKSTPGIDQYLKAVNILRHNLDDSDSALVTIALLCLYESTVRQKVGPRISHRRGITAIAKARRSSKASSDVARAVLHGNWTQDFRTSVAEGVPSPFEDAEWINSGPAYRVNNLLPEVVSLRGLAQKAYIRLPRLIALARRLRETASGLYDRSVLDQATTLAIQLNELRDIKAESELLHNVHVYQTKDYQAAPIVPFSLRFETMDEFNAALLYWGARLTVINLCELLTQMEQESGRLWTSASGEHYGNLQEHKRRTIVNITMSWEFTSENGLTLGSPAMTQAVLAVWHALKDDISFNGMSPKVIKRWLVGVFGESVAGWPTSSTFEGAQLDEMSDAFVGGPIRGSLASIYN